MAEMNVRVFLNGPFEENCYLVWSSGSSLGFLIDPGSGPEKLLAECRSAGFQPSLILATHAHVDHVGAVAALKEATGAAFAMHPGDEGHLEMLEDAYAYYGMGSTKRPSVERRLEEGDEVEAGGLKLKVLHTPGHSPGSVCFYHATSETLFSGDTLFHRSVGRYDFPGGSREALQASIQSKLYALPDSVKVYPGHGPTTNLGDEKRLNPFVQAPSR
jgi:glyoxylase-like metal-dependent hydrolase (beta-lactamase superfamily II)